MTVGGGHLRCPYCEAYGVDRLYLASLRADTCACAACGARWDEDPGTGEVLGHADSAPAAGWRASAGAGAADA